MSRFGAEVVLDRPAFIHETALVFGRVRIGADASLWPYAVIRAESDYVEIGRGTNVQDHAMVHIGGAYPTRIGDWCSITHKVCIHGATIGDNCLIGIGATIMDGAVIGANSIVAGHSIVTEGTVVPPGSIVAGVPAKVIAQLREDPPQRAALSVERARLRRRLPPRLGRPRLQRLRGG